MTDTGRDALERFVAHHRPAVGERAVEAFHAYARTPEFRAGFDAARGMSADELAQRVRDGRQARARAAAEAIQALRPQEPR